MIKNNKNKLKEYMKLTYDRKEIFQTAKVPVPFRHKELVRISE